MSPNRPDHIACVILNWNGGDVVLECLEALLAHGEGIKTVILVDNGSEDGSLEKAAQRFSEVEVIQNGENLGYAEGNNRGLARAMEAGADAVLLLNNDAFVEPGFLEPLRDVLNRDSKVGLCGPKILDDENRDIVWCAGADVTFGRNVSRLRGHGCRDDGSYDREEDVDYLPGAALLIHRDVLESIGFLDPLYFCYMEDVDFCVRARRAGFRIRYVPGSRIFHRASTSTGGGYTPQRKYMNAVNSIHFMKRYGSFRTWTRFIASDILTLPVAFVAALIQGHARAGWAKAQGILDGIRGIQVTPQRLRERFSGGRP